jgi:hypothetical protein
MDGYGSQIAPDEVLGLGDILVGQTWDLKDIRNGMITDWGVRNKNNTG